MSVKLVLSRKSAWLNRARPFKVLVDGEPVGKIGNGKVEEFELSQINQTVECKVDWCYSNKYEITSAEGDIIYLQVKNGMKGFWILYAIIMITFLTNLIAPRFFASMGAAGSWIKMAVFGSVLLYFIYYLTIGRRKYLSLEKDKDNVFAS